MNLFRSHIDLAHDFWKKVLQPGDIAIDATCGNGNDSLFLAQLIAPTGQLHCIDLQKEAIENTRSKLKFFLSNTHFYHGSHIVLPPVSPKIIVYNLGYLPGSDKSVTTMTASTLASIENALQIIRPGGLISITCYPGHSEGAVEEKSISNFVSSISKNKYTSTSIEWKNRLKSPSLIFIQRTCN
ncbi:MAG: class I SAM-dependent methyltransferase [Candidatus Algichlamydia australiensis]|nr:class I SAM-dependent methyltransferase [Chlamydiales bacterium]